MLAVIVSLLQGYTFVPLYRLLYVGASFAVRTVLPERRRDAAPLSSLNLICDLLSLLAACLLLLVPYRAYFAFVEPIPRYINVFWIGCYFLGFVIFRVRQEMELGRARAEQPVYIDLSRKDDEGRLLLDSFWTLRDLERHWITLKPGLVLRFYTEEGNGQRTGEGVGIVHFDQAHGRFVLSTEKRKSEGLGAQAAAEDHK